MTPGRLRATRTWHRGLTALALVASALPATSFADVTLRRTTVTSGMGGFGDGTREQTLAIAGDRSRSDEVFTSTLPPKSAAGRPRKSSSITRIDRELIWRIDDERKQFSEMTFSELRGSIAGGADDHHGHDHGPGGHGHDVEMEFATEVRRTGKKQNVNGFAAEQVIVTTKGRPKKPKPGADATITLRLELWLSRAVPGADEIRAHDRLKSEGLGVDQELHRMAGSATVSYGGPLRELGSRLEDLKGYPVRTILTIESHSPPRAGQMGGRKATAAGAMPAPGAELRSVSDLKSVTVGDTGTSFDIPSGYTQVSALAGPWGIPGR